MPSKTKGLASTSAVTLLNAVFVRERSSGCALVISQDQIALIPDTAHVAVKPAMQIPIMPMGSMIGMSARCPRVHATMPTAQARQNNKGSRPIPIKPLASASLLFGDIGWHGRTMAAGESGPRTVRDQRGDRNAATSLWKRCGWSHMMKWALSGMRFRVSCLTGAYAPL